MKSLLIISCAALVTFLVRTPASFSIEIDPSADGFAMYCSEGCDWEALTWTAKPYQMQAFGVAGMMSKNDLATTDHGFQVIASRTEEGFRFRCIEGCYWEETTVSQEGGTPIVLTERGISTQE